MPISRAPDLLVFEKASLKEDDAKLILTWRNDPETLSMFFHSQPKTFEEFWKQYQTEYFDAAIPDPVFILVGGERSGFLRFRRSNHPRGWPKRVVDISINIAPEKRKRDIGLLALQKADEYASQGGIESIYAEIREKNIASQTLFLKAGYTSLGLSIKLIEDTGERCSIHRMIKEISGINYSE